MNDKSSISPLLIGLALFAMFFGSGNLIFPLNLGVVSGGHWLEAFFGFVISAVFLPLMGIVAMILYEGRYKDFFSMIGSRPGFLLTAFLLTVWIPLGAAPRCIVLSHASLATYFTQSPSLWVSSLVDSAFAQSLPLWVSSLVDSAFAQSLPLWVFSLLYSALVFVIIFGKFKLLDFLGKWVTIPFLTCLAVIFIFTVWTFGFPPLELPEDSSFFTLGILEGYNTMDLIASFFFSATIIQMLAKGGDNTTSRLRPMLKASGIVTLLLGSVYLILIIAAASGASSLVGVEPKRLLSFLALQALGNTWSIVAIVAIILACFSTSVALILAYAEFLRSWLFTGKRSYFLATVASLVLSFATSLTDLAGITAITAPILRICYPLLIVLTVADLALKLWKARREALS